MSILVTTQSYNKDIPTEYGMLLELDENSGRVLRSCTVNTPVTSEKPDERIKPGLRGICEYGDKLYTCTWNRIIIIDKDNFEVEGEISHKWMSDLHGIYVNNDGIFVTSSLPDAVILYDFSGYPKSSVWLPETFLYNKKSNVDKSMDWRQRGKDFRGFREYHSNHVEISNDYIYITGRGRYNNGCVIRINKKAFLEKEYLGDQDITLFVKGLHGPHDGIWDNGLFWVTETDGSTIAAIDRNGKVKLRKKVKESERERISYKSFRELFRSKVKEIILTRPGKKITHWTRGLSVSSNYMYVGQSTLAGETQSRARIVKIRKDKTKIVACFYMHIDNYPEIRIFQLWYCEDTI